MSTNEDLAPSEPPASREEESHALERLVYFLKQRSAVIGHRPRATVSARPPAPPAPAADALSDAAPPDLAAPVLAFKFPADFRSSLLHSYRERQQSSEESAVGAAPPAAALAAPANNWVPRGPSVVRRGQAANSPPVSGRIAGIALAREHRRVYVASANGGVWRSDDGGASWRSTMEAWDLDPTTESSDSLSCGAIAIDLDDPDRVYVGTGEGDNVFIRGGAVIGTFAYFGVGPIRSDDGGQNWHQEDFAPDSKPPGGSAFYALAVDPADRERVVGATIYGLYRREPDGGGGYHWARKRAGIFTSVVAARDDEDGTVFFAARWGGAVFFSDDGETWHNLGTGLPASSAGRVGLAVQPHNPQTVYYLAEKQGEHTTLGVWRFDKGAGGAWKPVTNYPPDVLGDQGSYDLAIVVDPEDVNLLYLGGATIWAGGQWTAALFRCRVSPSGAHYSMTWKHIGRDVHPDVHALQFTPGQRDSLWVGCDGGLFYNATATTSDDFVHRNAGLATLTLNDMGLHPTQEAVLFCGTQDNGTVRYTGEEVWLHSASGDGGCVVVNWNDPYRLVRVYIWGQMDRTSNGGQSYDSWDEDVSLPADVKRAEFYAPLIGTPYNPAAPAEAERLAFGGRRPWISDDFGDNWYSIPADKRKADELDFNILSLAFASARRLYAGTDIGPGVDEHGEPATAGGDVFMYEEVNGAWTRTLVAADPLPAAPVTSITVDPADESGQSIYVTLGGINDYRHVWHYDGSRWEARSGPHAGSLNSLLDVQHNVLAVDPKNPGHLYVGADIGVWRSTDSGATWQPFVNGLPDAAVVDLKIFGPARVLLASTHGRGVFERTLDSETALGTELYVRDTQLDLRRAPAAYGDDDPTRFGKKIGPGNSPDIKVDTQSASGGYQTGSGPLSFLDFVDVLVDQSNNVAALDAGGGVLTHRVHVQVHNRGIVPADDVVVMLLLAPASQGAPDLPVDYEFSLSVGIAINTPQWKTVGFRTLHGVEVGLPKVASFALPSNMLLPPVGGAPWAEYVLLVLLHATSDAYTAAERSVSLLSQTERKAASQKIRVR